MSALVPLLFFFIFGIIGVIYCNARAWINIRKDKEKAEAGEYRIPEDELLSDAFCGGIGGLLAMERFHHKTAYKKRDFRKKYQHRCLYGSVLQLIVIVVLIMGIDLLFMMRNHRVALSKTPPTIAR